MENPIKAFKDAIRCGTGDAILILKDNSDIDLDDIIFEACCHNLAYDPQIEGARATYLNDIVNLSYNKERLKARIISSLLKAQDDSWDTYQLFRLVACFAKSGDAYAKDSLYRRYANNIDPNYDYIETDVLVDVDGFDGFLFTIKTMVEYTKLDNEFWIDDSLLYSLEEYLPNTNISSLLKDSAKDNQYIQTYLNQPRIQNWLNIKAAPAAEDEKTCQSRPTYKKLSELIQQDKHLGRMAARQADLKDLKRLSDDFESCTNTRKRTRGQS